MRIVEFKDFLEKQHIKIRYTVDHLDNTILGEFYLYDKTHIKPLNVECMVNNTYCEIIDVHGYDNMLDIFVQALARESKIDNLRDQLISALAGDITEDDYEICEVECPNGRKKDCCDDGPDMGVVKPSIREETLDTAKKCVMGDREQDYGTPESNFATIAKFWSDYLDMDISVQQVADMMILMKVSRIKNGGGTGDSYVDIAGYAACGNEILSKAHK